MKWYGKLRACDVHFFPSGGGLCVGRFHLKRAEYAMNNHVVGDDGAEVTFPMAVFLGQPNEFDLGVVHDSYLGSKERSEF